MKLFLYFLGLVNLISAADWGYTGIYGPSYWKDDSPDCGYSRQSPIHINTSETVENNNYTHFVFEGYGGINDEYILVNNGHTVGELLPANVSSISGGGLTRIYYADQFHLHWGSNNTQGSEHVVDGKMYPAELHIVHHSSRYADLGEAVDKGDGLAVLGIFLELGEHNYEYDKLCDHLQDVKYPGDVQYLESFPLKDLLPSDVTEFWRYSGSLTTPPCYESVTWTVFKQPVEVDEPQLETLRSLLISNTEPMVNNYRPVQPIGDRKVYSCKTKDAEEQEIEIQDSEDDDVDVQVEIRWDYIGHYGESHWGQYYPACSGSSQSPINIVREETIYKDDFEPFSFTNYDKSSDEDYVILNNGHTVGQILPLTMNVSGGGLPTTYITDQLHFHWALADTKGSEHTIDGMSYPLEMHIVHHSSKYADLFKAINQDDGLAVLGVFFKVGSYNPAFDQLVKHLENVTFSGETANIGSFPLETLLPSDLGSFYRYRGSLTTPPCYESVVWTVFHEPVEISEQQLEIFRSMKKKERDSSSNALMAPNYRPVHPVLQRKVYTSVYDPSIHVFSSSSSRTMLSSFAILGLLCASMLFL